MLSGPATGSYRSREGSARSLLGGDACILWFSEGKLSRLEMYDEAYCTRLTEDKDDVTVSGDVLRLDFEAGEVAQIIATGAVQGRYQTETEEAQ